MIGAAGAVAGMALVAMTRNWGDAGEWLNPLGWFLVMAGATAIGYAAIARRGREGAADERR